MLQASCHKSVTGVQDGTERNIESISLIDAVLPDVIEQRKQGALKGPQFKDETHGPNGEEGEFSLLPSDYTVYWHKLVLHSCQLLHFWQNLSDFCSPLPPFRA